MIQLDESGCLIRDLGINQVGPETIRLQVPGANFDVA